jgi:hypothetical protein
MQNEILSATGLTNTANIKYDKYGQSKALLTKISAEIFNGMADRKKQ